MDANEMKRIAQKVRKDQMRQALKVGTGKKPFPLYIIDKQYAWFKSN